MYIIIYEERCVIWIVNYRHISISSSLRDGGSVSCLFLHLHANNSMINSILVMIICPSAMFNTFLWYSILLLLEFTKSFHKEILWYTPYNRIWLRNNSWFKAILLSAVLNIIVCFSWMKVTQNKKVDMCDCGVRNVWLWLLSLFSQFLQWKPGYVKQAF